MTKRLAKLSELVRRAIAEPNTRDDDIDSAHTSSRRKTMIKSKRFVKGIYADWYEQIARSHVGGKGHLLEIGSGGGFMREVVPDTISSDVLSVDGIDVVLDACALPFRDGSLRGVSMTNVFHHLPDVESFLAEASRCVAPGGVVAMIEPWATPWSRWIYKSFHHEPFDPDADSWKVPSGRPLSEANGALPWIVFKRDLAVFKREFPSLELIAIRPLMPILYLLSGGLSMRTLMPTSSFRLCRSVDRWLIRLLPASAMFACIVLRRRESDIRVAN